jgi:hypothetical protein
MRTNLIAITIALTLALAPLTATAGATCSTWTSRSGAVYVTLHANPGGDGALYVYVDGVQTTWFSTRKRRFYVTGKRGAVVRGYSSELVLLCSN